VRFPAQGAPRALIEYCAVAAAAVLPYLSALPNGFTIDDSYLVLKNTGIRFMANIPSFFAGAWGGAIGAAFYSKMNAGYYRPVTMAFYSLEYALFGYSPLGWHAASIALHILASLLVLSIAKRLFVRETSGETARTASTDANARFGCVAAAVLFGVHPVHSEVLNPATFQTTLLAGLGALGAFRIHLGAPSWRRALFTSASLLAGLLAKENAVVAPLLILFYDLIFGKGTIKKRFHLGTYAALAIACVAYFCLRFAFISFGGGYSFFRGQPFHAVAATMLKVAALYGRLLVFPTPLCSFYDWYIVSIADSFWDIEVLCGLAILIILVLFVALLWRKSPPVVALALAWIPLSLAHVSHIFPILNVAAERFLYVSSVGFCLLVGYLVSRSKSVFVLIAFGLATIVFSYLTFERNFDFKDNTTLNQAFARDYPYSPTPHINLASIYKAQGRWEEALGHLESARKLEPRIPGPWIDGIQINLKLGRRDTALNLARRAVSAGIDPERLPIGPASQPVRGESRRY
jgi:hypothetical protein